MGSLPSPRGGSIEKFEKEAKSILWRQAPGPNKERREYSNWKVRVAEIQEGDGVSHIQAVVKASLEFTCLAPLMNEYNLSTFGLDGGPNIIMDDQVLNMNEARSYRENLRWAVDAAGRYQRTKKAPEECPNDSAYYLYQQALQDPKDFLAKLGQMETKVNERENELEDYERAGKRSINEIDDMLQTLDEENE